VGKPAECLLHEHELHGRLFELQKLGDDVVIVIQLSVVYAALKQSEGELAVVDILGVHEGQNDEEPLDELVAVELGAARDDPLGHAECNVIEHECLLLAPEEGARQLIAQDDERQPPLVTALPLLVHAHLEPLKVLVEVTLHLLVELGVVLEPPDDEGGRQGRLPVVEQLAVDRVGRVLRLEPKVNDPVNPLLEVDGLE